MDRILIKILEILDLKEFGFRVVVFQLFSRIINRLMPLSKISYYVTLKKHNIILDYLYSKYYYVIEQFAEYEQATPEQSYKIWVLWWQGLDNAPPIVRKCIQRIYKMYPNHEIVLLTQNNISDYIHLEQKMLDLVSENKIAYAHLSDVIRMRMMHQYGGTWMDATLYFTDVIDLNKPLVTLHLRCNVRSKNVAQGKWCTYFVGGVEKSILVAFVDGFLKEYWGKETKVIDYLLLDYIIQLGYLHIPRIRTLIDGVPYNSAGVDILQKNMNNPYNHDVYLKICKDTCVHKLSYKFEPVEYVNGVPTFYRNLIIED